MDVTCRQHGRAPLTFLQQARLERSRQARAAGSPARSNLVTDAVSVTGPLDLDRLARALAGVRARQPALRSRFAPDYQTIVPCLPEPAVPRIGLSLPAELPPEEPDRYALSAERTAPDRHLLRLVADHLVFDARSVELFWENLWDAYREPHAEPGCRCEPGYLELLTAAPGQPGHDDRTAAVAAVLRERDSPFGFVDLPVRLPLGQVGSRRVSVLASPVPERLAARVVELARLRRTTVFAVVTAASLAAVREVAGTRTPMLYTFLENRGSAGARRAIGWFAATTLLVADAPDASDAPDSPDGPDGPNAPDSPDGPDTELARAKRLLLDALLHGARRTEEVHRACGAGGRPASLPSVSLSLGPIPRQSRTVGDLTVAALAEEDEPTGTVPRGRIAIEYWPGLFQLSFETDRFDVATVRSLADALREHLVRLTS